MKGFKNLGQIVPNSVTGSKPGGGASRKLKNLLAYSQDITNAAFRDMA